MKKVTILYLLPFLTLPLFSMNESASVRSKFEVILDPITYKINNKLEGKWHIKVLKVIKKASEILAERDREMACVPPQERNYIQENIAEGHYLLKPTMLPLYCQFAADANSDIWFETNEFNVKGGGMFELELAGSSYSIYTGEKDSVNKRVDSDSFKNAQARYAARAKSAIHNLIMQDND